MKSETSEIQATSVKEAIDTTIAQSGFGLNAGVLLDSFLNLGVKFPFKIAEVAANGAIKLIGDLKGAYNQSTTNTTGGTSTDTTVETYKVTTPINGWTVEVK